jgi:hypothetical protein
LKIPFTSKSQDIQGENPNCPPHIAATLQGTQNPPHKANLAKELQLPTHGKQSFNSGRQKTKKKKRKTAFGGFVLFLLCY